MVSEFVEIPTFKKKKSVLAPFPHNGTMQLQTHSVMPGHI